MTNMDRDSAQADLAFLRQLVDEEDWRRPVRFFGATYLAIGLAVIAQILVTDVAPLAPPFLLFGIIAVWAVYSIVQMVINARLNPGKLGASLRGRAAATGFLGMVLSHMTLVIVFLITAISQQDGGFMKLAALSFFALQGGMWLMLHTLRREGWQLAVALGWLASAILAAFFLNTPVFGFVVAIVVLVLMVGPGLYLLKVAKGGAS